MPIDIPLLLQTAGGEIVGKVRFQKTVYLLDQIGMNSGFTYEYHHYGPYSAELSDQLDDDAILGRVDVIPRRRASDGVPYSAFHAGQGVAIPEDENLGDITLDRARIALATMQNVSATVLELAATIHWLAFKEEIANWRKELVDRKGVKTASGRDKDALDLLGQLGIAPA